MNQIIEKKYLLLNHGENQMVKWMKAIFTSHAEYRIKKRKLTQQEVLDAIKYPDKTIKKHGKYYYQKKLDRGTIEIVVERAEKNIKIITIYWL